MPAVIKEGTYTDLKYSVYKEYEDSYNAGPMWEHVYSTDNEQKATAVFYDLLTDGHTAQIVDNTKDEI